MKEDSSVAKQKVHLLCGAKQWSDIVQCTVQCNEECSAVQCRLHCSLQCSLHCSLHCRPAAGDQRNMQLVDCTLSPRLPPTLWSLLSVFSPYSVIKTIQQLFCFCSYLMISRPWKEWPVQLLQVNLRSASVAVQQCLYNIQCIDLYDIHFWKVYLKRQCTFIFQTCFLLRN